MDQKGEVTVLLERLSAGDRSVEDALMPYVYVELHRLATRHLQPERQGHTLQATALVHEVYLRLCEQAYIAWQGRIHFFRLAARLMRRVLIDYARQRNALKRCDGLHPVELNEALLIREDKLDLAVQIDALLRKLALMTHAQGPRQAQVVELKFFAGMSDEEIASVLQVSVRTVKRDWLMARAWMHRQLDQSPR